MGKFKLVDKKWRNYTVDFLPQISSCQCLFRPFDRFPYRVYRLLPAVWWRCVCQGRWMGIRFLLPIPHHHPLQQCECVSQYVSMCELVSVGWVYMALRVFIILHKQEGKCELAINSYKKCQARHVQRKPRKNKIIQQSKHEKVSYTLSNSAYFK